MRAIAQNVELESLALPPIDFGHAGGDAGVPCYNPKKLFKLNPALCCTVW